MRFRMEHRSYSHANRQLPPDTEPEPGYHCREMRIPIDVVELVGTPIPGNKRGQVFTHTHATLLGYIEMMVNTRGLGCWASNRYLGAKIHRSEDRVKKLLRDCRRLGLLVDRGACVVKFGNGRTLERRVIETSWSRSIPLPRTGGGVTGNPRRGVTGNPQVLDLRESTNLSGVEPPDSAGGFDDGGGINPDDSPMSDLFGNETAIPPRGTDYSPFDMLCAESLWTAVTTRTQRRVRSSKSKWANEFRLLRMSITGPDPEPRISAALAWYVANINGDKIPEVFCGAAFREKFDRIEAAAKRAANPNKHPAFVPDKVTVTAPARQLADRALNYEWPKGTGAYAPALAQACLDNAAAYSAQVAAARRALKAKRNPDVRDAALERNLALLDRVDINPEFYVGQWLDRVRRDVAGWANWSGDLTRFVLRADHKWFVAARTEDAGDSAAWERAAALIATGGR